MATIAMPFEYANLRAPNDAALSNNGHSGTFTPVLLPGELPWSLRDDLHVLAGLWVYADDVSSSPAKTRRAGAGLGRGAACGRWSRWSA